MMHWREMLNILTAIFVFSCVHFLSRVDFPDEISLVDFDILTKKKTWCQGKQQ